MSQVINEVDRIRRKALTPDEVAYMLKLADAGTLVVEIAETLSMAPGTLANALYRARKARRARVAA